MPDDGACAFPIDPARSAFDAPALWDPVDVATVVILDGVDRHWLLSGGITNSDMLASYNAADGDHLVLADPAGRLRLWLRGGPSARTCDFVIPADQGFAARSHATARAAARLLSLPDATPLIVPQPSTFQATRLNLLLALLDAEAAGASTRAMGRLVYPAVPRFSALEWKASAERRRVQRLLAEARALRDGGYRALLIG